MPTCFKLFYPSLDGISVHAVHFKKRSRQTMALKKMVHLTLLHRRSKTEPVRVTVILLTVA